MIKQEFLNLIKSHIQEYGYHITIVSGNTPLPRYYYTIGLKEILSFELAFAGGIIYKDEEIKEIISSTIENLKLNPPDKTNSFIKLTNLGNFEISLIDKSWSLLMFDGIFDYYNSKDIDIYQIIPDKEHKTLEVPNMNMPYIAEKQPIWKWLTENWNFPVNQNAVIFTDIDALFGKEILEVMRWEELEWEMFTDDGTKIPIEKKRAISLGTMLGIDNTLLPAINLNIEKGLWRKSNSLEWNKWG